MMPNYDYSKDLTSDNKNGLVYVIDDDADVRESIKWLLESTNYRVEDYESGETFIAQFNGRRPSRPWSNPRTSSFWTCACPACRVQMCKII